MLGTEGRFMSRLEDTEIVNIMRLLLKIRWEIERTPFKDRKYLSTLID